MAARLFALCVAVVLLSPHPACAQGKAKLAREVAEEVAEYVMRKFGKEGAREGVETLTRKIETLAIKHGDDAFVAARKVGPQMFRLVEEAGEHEHQCIKLLAKYGDDATWVVAKPNRLAIFVKFGDDAAEAMMKHGEIAEPLLQSMGKPAAAALKAVSSQNARRLAMLAEDGQLAKIGRTPELLDVIAKYGDPAMDFIWRNKGALTVGAALTAFLANPEPFLKGTADITRIVAENAVKPIADVPLQIAHEAAKQMNWTVAVVFALCVFGLVVALRMWLRHRHTPVPAQTPGAAEPKGLPDQSRDSGLPRLDTQADGSGK